jgi:hypothetical protein
MDRLLAEVSIDSRRQELSSGRAATAADPHSVIRAALAVRIHCPWYGLTCTLAADRCS